MGLDELNAKHSVRRTYSRARRKGRERNYKQTEVREDLRIAISQSSMKQRLRVTRQVEEESRGHYVRRKIDKQGVEKKTRLLGEKRGR